MLGISPQAWVGLAAVWGLAAVYRSAEMPFVSPAPPQQPSPAAEPANAAYVKALERYVVESNHTINQLEARLREQVFGRDAAPEAAAAPPPPPPPRAKEGAGGAVSKAAAAPRAARHSARSTAWAPVTLDADDWIVYLRVQKTGSQTLWLTMIETWDGSLWSPSSRCVRGPFCGHKCEDVLRTAFRDHKSKRKCQLFVRAHANWYDYERALAGLPAGGPRKNRIRWLAFLRDPVKRALSEHEHITRGLVAQFGAHTFGKAWDYDFTDPKKASLGDWLACAACQRGARNRQTRFLAGLATTGELADGEGTRDGDARLLEAALDNLHDCAFLGVLDRFQDSMLLLKMTFPKQLRKFQSYKNEQHPKLPGDAPVHSQAALDKLKDLNNLDIALYEAAQALFDTKFEQMVASLPPAQQNRRFRQKGRTFVLS